MDPKCPAEIYKYFNTILQKMNHKRNKKIRRLTLVKVWQRVSIRSDSDIKSDTPETCFKASETALLWCMSQGSTG